MYKSLLVLSAVGLTVTAIIQCGGTTGTVDPNRIPKVHRASAMTCPDMRPPVISDAGVIEGGVVDSGFPGSCNQDSDCTAGKNGRCGYSRIGKTCTYDTCFSDVDCMGNGVCECRTTGANANVCVGTSQMGCRVDSDCGTRYCSPSLGTCGNYSGTVGYFCHTTSDTCVDDSDCTEAGNGFCMFDTKVKHWQCSYSFCVG